MFYLSAAKKYSMKDENTLLREENERLKLIIALLTQQFGASKQQSNADLQMGKEAKQFTYTYLQTEDGIALLSQPNSPSNIGIVQPPNADAGKGDGLIQVYNAVPSSGIGTVQVSEGNSPPGIGTVQPVQPLSPAAKASAQLHFSSIRWGVRRAMPNCRHSSHDAATKILIQLLSSERNTTKQWRDLTGLTTSGVAKQLMMLRKRGLIIRTRFQLYGLTGTALEMVEKATQV
jgi:hypothetical protein